MTQNPNSIEVERGPDGSFFLPEDLTLPEIASEMFKLFQDRDTARGMSLEEKLAIATGLDEQRDRLMGGRGLTLAAGSL